MEDELRDIKGLVEVPDYSLWILLSIIFCIIILLIFIIYFYKNRRKKRKKLSLKQIAKIDLKKIDFNDTKKAVYTFSENFQYFITEENKQAFEKLQERLNPYKYRKNIEKLPSELQKEIKNMIKDIK